MNLKVWATLQVSQTNPHIVPLLNIKRGMSSKWGKIVEAELKHRCQVSGQEGGGWPGRFFQGRILCWRLEGRGGRRSRLL